MLRALVVLALVLLSVVRATGQESSARSAEPLSIAQVWKLDATYTDKEHGVGFRYPSVWKATTQFAHNPPVLAVSDDAKPIAAFGYSEGGFPRTGAVGPYAKTNLEGFGIVYSAVPATSPQECEAKAASLASKRVGRQAMFGDHSFSVREIEEAGMSQSTSGKLYATYARSTCYLFETDVAVVSPGVADGIEPLNQAQIDRVEVRLRLIMSSVWIEPGP